MIDASIQSERFCSGCLHSLRGITSRRCPECGREFDPADERTTLADPRAAYPELIAIGVRVLIRAIVVLAAIAFVACVIGFDRPRIPLTPFALLATGAFVVVPFMLAVSSRMHLKRRDRLAGTLVPLLLVSILGSRWPLYLAFRVCPSWLDAMANRIQAKGVTPPSGYGGMLSLRRGVVEANGSVGFQLTGHEGGGIFLVRSAGPPAAGSVWINTNWVKSLGGRWYLVEQD